MSNEFKLRSAAVDQKKATHWAKGKIANSIRQCSFVTCFHLKICLQSIKLCACATFPANNYALKKWCSSKKCSFPYKASTSTKKVVVIYKLVVAFELVKCFFFRKTSFCEGRILLKNDMCNMYCVLKCSIPVFFLCHGNSPSGRCCFLQRLNT